MIAQKLVQQEGYSVRQACDFLDLAPSSYYYQSKALDDERLEADLKLEAGKHPTYEIVKIFRNTQKK